MPDDGSAPVDCSSKPDLKPLGVVYVRGIEGGVANLVYQETKFHGRRWPPAGTTRERRKDRGPPRPKNHAFSIRVHIPSNVDREKMIDDPERNGVERAQMKMPQIEVDPKLIKITPELVRRVSAWKGGKALAGKTSPAKRKASRENGKKGGRPKRSQLELNLK